MVYLFRAGTQQNLFVKHALLDMIYSIVAHSKNDQFFYFARIRFCTND